MIITERHSIKPSSELIRFCSLTKQLYNKCNYIVRQAFFSQRNTKNRLLPDAKFLIKELKTFPAYIAIASTKTSKQTIRKCLTDWSNFFKALKAYALDKSKFQSCPKPPGYKNKLAQVIFDNETIKGGLSGKPLEFLTANNNLFSIKSNKRFKTVTVTPKTFGFIIDVTYESDDVKQEHIEKETKTCSELKLDKQKLCTIDLGVNNLCAITLDQKTPLLVNGRILKSINSHYNKKCSKLKASNPLNKIPDKWMKKRYFRIENYFHHASKFIIQKCLEHGCGTIVIGRNKGWKQNTKKHRRMRKKNRTEFQNIPFYRLQQKLEYKAKLVGIVVEYVEEAYTSQASFYDNDSLPSYEEAVELKKQNKMPVFSGVRKHRGLYVSKNNIVTNADIQGSLNIGRKFSKINVIPESEPMVRIGNKSLAARPCRVNPLKFYNLVPSGKHRTAMKEQDRSRSYEVVLQGSSSSQLVSISNTKNETLH